MSDRDQIEGIKDNIDLRDLISESCKLDSNNRGAHENKHESKSGNCLYVDTKQNLWKCHHCNKGGSAIDWIMDRDNVGLAEAIQTAAILAHVTLGNIDPKAEQEKHEVYDVLEAAARHFNENLTDDNRADITARWGITNKTMNDLLIGISPTDLTLEKHLKQQGFTRDQMLKSGLFFDGKHHLFPQFMGRYVFPYWERGVVRYGIGRLTKYTPKRKGGDHKYLKMPLHKNNPHVSKHVEHVIYGVDSLRGESDWCLVTEGITDCIMAQQAGIPCISPVTVRFQNADNERILKHVKRFDTVYICNDNEDTEAGIEGAIGTADRLESDGTTVRLITLPRPEGAEKIDLAEYLRDNDVNEFTALFDTAVSVWEVKLSRQVVNGDAVENAKAAKKFIADETMHMSGVERVAFIETSVKAHFGLSDGICNELVKVVPPAPPPAAPDSDNYFMGKTFIPKLLADEIMSQNVFKTMKDTGEVYVYDEGIYTRMAETIIKAAAQKALDNKSTTHRISEVVGHIQRATYTERGAFDTDKKIINLANGLFDFEAMEIRPHTPDYLSLRKSPIVYDPAAVCQRTDLFFEEVLLKRDILFMYEIFGYALLKEKRLATAVMFEGQGRNGKSKMIQLLNTYVGIETTANITPNELSGDDKFASADLFGKLLNTVDDLSNVPLKNLGVFKSIVDSMKIRAQHKNRPAFDFTPSALCVFGCNDVPITTDTSDGFFRRMRLVPFLRKFDDDDPGTDPNLFDKLATETELSGLFNRAIRAAKKAVVAGRFTGAGTIDDKRKDYVYASNPVARFVNDMCDTTDRDDYIAKDELYNAYVLWSRDENERVEQKGRLTTHLEEIGCVVRQITGADGTRRRLYVGIKLAVPV